MNTETLIADAKARFAHNSAKSYLKQKYENKLIFADQGGLWQADVPTITFLSSSTEEFVILSDTFNNLVKVNRQDLLDKLWKIYKEVTEEWYKEWSELEKKR